MKKIIKFLIFLPLSLFGLLLLWYILGYTTNLIKAVSKTIKGEMFISPSGDISTNLMALLDWQYSKYALMLFGVILLIIIAVIIKSRIESSSDDRNFSVSKKGTYGTAIYLTKKQAAALTTADGKNKLLTIGDNTQKEEGIILGRLDGKTVYKNALPKENNNIFVNGSPGSGKSYMFVRPYLAQCIKRGESFVCTDPSGELLESMGGYAKENGYTIRVYNLVAPSRSDGWNITEDVGLDQKNAQVAVETIIRNTLEGGKPDQFWDNGEKNLLKALLLYVNSEDYTGEKSLGAVYELLAASDFESKTLKSLEALPPDHAAKMPYNIFMQAKDQVRQSFASGLATRLQILQSKEVRDMTSESYIDLTAPGKEKCAYFVIMSEQDSTFQLLSSLFFSFLFIKLSEYAKTCPNQLLPIRVNIVLDELPSIGQIPDLGRRVATVRKYGINVIPIIQLISQLDNRYSPAERDEIIGCCDTQLWLGSNDITSAEVLSVRSGQMTVDVSSKTEKAEFFASSQITSSVGKRPVLTVDEVLRLPLDESIIVLRGQNIMKLKKYPFADYPDYKAIQKAKRITISDYKPNEDSILNENKSYATARTTPPPPSGPDNYPEPKKPKEPDNPEIPSRQAAPEEPPKRRGKARGLNINNKN